MPCIDAGDKAYVGAAARRKQGAGAWQYKALACSDDGSALYALESSRWVRITSIVLGACLLVLGVMKLFNVGYGDDSTKRETDWRAIASGT